MSEHLLRELFIPINREDRNLTNFVIIAVKMDTPQSCDKKCQMKKYEECGMIRLSKRMMLPHGIAELATSTVDPEPLKTPFDR